MYVKDFFTSSQSSPSLAGWIQNSSLTTSSFFLVPTSTLGMSFLSVVPSDITVWVATLFPSSSVLVPSCPSDSTIGAVTPSDFIQVSNHIEKIIVTLNSPVFNPATLFTITLESIEFIEHEYQTLKIFKINNIFYAYSINRLWRQ